VADVFVAVDDDVALAALDRDGRDLVGELAGLLRGLGLVLGADGEFVLHVAGDLPLLGHVLGGLAHVVAVEGVPQTVADHRVDVFQVAHLLALPQRRGMGAHRHVLLPAGDDDIGIAQHDVLGAQRHGAKARAADLVDAPGRAFLRQACVDMRLTRRVLTLRRGQHLAEDGFGDLRLVHAGALDHRLDDDAAQFMRGGVGEGAEEAADRRACRAGDDDVGHGVPFPCLSCVGPIRHAAGLRTRGRSERSRTSRARKRG
jgi:hypothetical protein